MKIAFGKNPQEALMRSYHFADTTGVFKAVVLIMLVAVVARFAVFSIFWHDWLWQRGIVHDWWNHLAINLVNHGIFGFYPAQSTVFRGPVFPVLLAPLYMLFGEHYVWWSVSLLLFDSGTCLLVMLLGRKLWGNTSALLAGFFYALYLPIIYYTANIEQFTSVLPLTFLWFYFMSTWDRGENKGWHLVVLGLISGLLTLSKSVYLPITFAAVFAILFFNFRKSGLTRLLREGAVVLVIMAAVVAPWTYRNYQVTGGRFIPVQSLFWDQIWQQFMWDDLNKKEGMNRPDGRSEAYRVIKTEELLKSKGGFVPHGHGEIDLELFKEQVFKERSIECIKQDPMRFAKCMLSNIWGFWARAENMSKTLKMVVMQGFFLAAAFFGLFMIVRSGRIAQVRFGILLLALLWAEYSLVLTYGRYSLDLAPILAVLFGLGIASLPRFNRHDAGRQVHFPHPRAEIAFPRIEDAVGKPGKGGE